MERDIQSRGISPDMPSGKGLDETELAIAEALDRIRKRLGAMFPDIGIDQATVRDLLLIGTLVRRLIVKRNHANDERDQVDQLHKEALGFLQEWKARAQIAQMVVDQWRPDEQRLIDPASDQVTPLCKSGDELVELVERLLKDPPLQFDRGKREGEAKAARFSQQAEVAQKNNDKLRAMLADAKMPASALRRDRDRWKTAAGSALEALERVNKQRNEARGVALRLADDLEVEDTTAAIKAVEDMIEAVRSGRIVPHLQWPED